MGSYQSKDQLSEDQKSKEQVDNLQKDASKQKRVDIQNNHNVDQIKFQISTDMEKKVEKSLGEQHHLYTKFLKWKQEFQESREKLGKSSKCILLCGSRGAGKSTLLHFLKGDKLIPVPESLEDHFQYTIQYQIQDKEDDQDNSKDGCIGNGKHGGSQPNLCWYIEEMCEEKSKEKFEEKYHLVDAPGFFDKNQDKLLHHFQFKHLLGLYEQIKVIFVLSLRNLLENRQGEGDFIEMYKNLENYIELEGRQHSIMFIVTQLFRDDMTTSQIDPDEPLWEDMDDEQKINKLKKIQQIQEAYKTKSEKVIQKICKELDQPSLKEGNWFYLTPSEIGCQPFSSAVLVHMKTIISQILFSNFNKHLNQKFHPFLKQQMDAEAYQSCENFYKSIMSIFMNYVQSFDNFTDSNKEGLIVIFSHLKSLLRRKTQLKIEEIETFLTSLVFRSKDLIDLKETSSKLQPDNYNQVLFDINQVKNQILIWQELQLFEFYHPLVQQKLDENHFIDAFDKQMEIIKKKQAYLNSRFQSISKQFEVNKVELAKRKQEINKFVEKIKTKYLTLLNEIVQSNDKFCGVEKSQFQSIIGSCKAVDESYEIFFLKPDQVDQLKNIVSAIGNFEVKTNGKVYQYSDLDKTISQIQNNINFYEIAQDSIASLKDQSKADEFNKFIDDSKIIIQQLELLIEINQIVEDIKEEMAINIKQKIIQIQNFNKPPYLVTVVFKKN